MKLPIVKDESYIHHKGQEFKHLPEVYQVELTNACNLRCPMCLRTTDMLRDDQRLDLDLLRQMRARGDFAGSFYVELQMAGEPTLHPQLGEAVRILKEDVGVLTGLSTHGLLMQKAGVITALLDLDALTISVDSVDPETYHQMRYPARIEQLYKNLELFFDCLRTHLALGREAPFVELQLVETSLAAGSGNVIALQEIMKARGWEGLAEVRTTADCFGEMQGRVEAGTTTRNAQICLNPFASVSVAVNGDVLSCCFIFDPKKDEVNYYGNLREQSLAEIWTGPRVMEMRRQHAREQLSGQCTKCYLKSPMQIHLNIVSRLVRRRALARRRAMALISAKEDHGPQADPSVLDGECR